MSGPEPLHHRAVLAVANGKPVYIQMAVNLARSFRRWHRGSDIAFQLATDQPDLVPPDVRSFAEIIPFQPGELGPAFTPKLSLDRLTRARHTLFVDADCLLYGSLDPLFAIFRGRAFSLIGDMRSNGEFWGSIPERCAKFGVSAVPKFMGAIYYFEQGETARAVFEKAREIEPRYDAVGMVRLGGQRNEEPLLGLAMALHGQQPVPDDGRFKADALHYPVALRASQYHGQALARNTPGHPRHKPAWPLAESRPLVMHFNNTYTNIPEYRAEARFLYRTEGCGWPGLVAWLESRALILWPERFVDATRDALRPAFRTLFGTRRVRHRGRLTG